MCWQKSSLPTHTFLNLNTHSTTGVIEAKPGKNCRSGRWRPNSPAQVLTSQNSIGLIEHNHANHTPESNQDPATRKCLSNNMGTVSAKGPCTQVASTVWYNHTRHEKRKRQGCTSRPDQAVQCHGRRHECGSVPWKHLTCWHRKRYKMWLADLYWSTWMTLSSTVVEHVTSQKLCLNCCESTSYMLSYLNANMSRSSLATTSGIKAFR